MRPSGPPIPGCSEANQGSSSQYFSCGGLSTSQGTGGWGQSLTEYNGDSWQRWQHSRTSLCKTDGNKEQEGLQRKLQQQSSSVGLVATTPSFQQGFSHLGLGCRSGHHQDHCPLLVVCSNASTAFPAAVGRDSHAQRKRSLGQAFDKKKQDQDVHFGPN